MYKMLVIEDEKHFFDTLYRMLLIYLENWEMDKCDDDDSFAELFPTNKYDLVIIDLLLKKSSSQGREFIAKIREHNTIIPIVIITAADHMLRPSDPEIKKYNIYDYIIKPILASELEKKIRNMEKENLFLNKLDI